MSAVISPDLETSVPVTKPQGDALGLFLVSVAGLFLELMLIRWIGSELPIFGFLQNAVLVVCFLGLGMGCWTCRQPVAIRDVLVPLAVLVLFVAVFVTLMDLGRFSPILSYVAWPDLGESPRRMLAT